MFSVMGKLSSYFPSCDQIKSIFSFFCVSCSSLLLKQLSSFEATYAVIFANDVVLNYASIQVFDFFICSLKVSCTIIMLVFMVVLVYYLIYYACFMYFRTHASPRVLVLFFPFYINAFSLKEFV